MYAIRSYYELAGERVEIADALHGDEERLVLRQPRIHQRPRLAAQVILQLVRIP